MTRSARTFSRSVAGRPPTDRSTRSTMTAGGVRCGSVGSAPTSARCSGVGGNNRSAIRARGGSLRALTQDATRPAVAPATAVGSGPGSTVMHSECPGVRAATRGRRRGAT